jgi:hypothetical protein
MAFLSRVSVAVVVTLLLLAPAAQAQELSLEGKVKPQHWTLDDLKKLPYPS